MKKMLMAMMLSIIGGSLYAAEQRSTDEVRLKIGDSELVARARSLALKEYSHFSRAELIQLIKKQDDAISCFGQIFVGQGTLIHILAATTVGLTAIAGYYYYQYQQACGAPHS